jgi:predicted P-loop ATPase
MDYITDPSSSQDEPSDTTSGLSGNSNGQPVARKQRKAHVVVVEDADPIIGRDRLWVACTRNAEIWLASQGVPVRYDTFRQRVSIGGRPLSDELVGEYISAIEASTRKAPWRRENIQTAIVNLASRSEFSSLTEWLDGLPPWDRVCRVEVFFEKAYQVKQDDYSAACARVLFFSAVARAHEPGCQADAMVVLISRKEGTRKSTGIAALCPESAWFAEDLGCDLLDRKAGEGLQGKWLFEFSEFARINRATSDAVKSFVSRRVDHYRPPYGRIARDYPRTCIFIGTTNNEQPLAQEGQHRRFLPIKVGDGDIEWIRANRDQLWAEALHWVRAGEKHWLEDPRLLAVCEQHREDARQDDAWYSVLAVALRGHTSTTMQAASALLEVPIERLDRSAQIRIGIILADLGFEPRREPTGARRRYYVHGPWPDS